MVTLKSRKQKTKQSYVQNALSGLWSSGQQWTRQEKSGKLKGEIIKIITPQELRDEKNKTFKEAVEKIIK